MFAQLDELKGAIEMASRDFSRFQIDAQELESRRQWTAHVRAQVRLLLPFLAFSSLVRRGAAS